MGKAQAKLSNELEGKIIVISGNFSISRDDMKALITAHGGKNSGSISGKTSYLLAGDKAGPEKLKKAEALGVQVISEVDFMNMISGASTNPEQSAPTTQINFQDKSANLENKEPEPYNGEQLSLF